MKENKLPWINDLRVLATIAVITVHVSAPLCEKYGAVPFSAWLTGNVYNSLSRFCVPVFLMISGALILPKNIHIKTFFGKSLVRIILPFLFWSLVYIAIKIDFKSSDVLLTILTNLQYGSSYHLWYIYMLFGIYLFIPIISGWIRNSSNKEIHFFLAIWIFTFFLRIPVISSYMPSIDFAYFAGYMGYVVLGYYLSNRIPEISIKARNIGIGLFVAGFVITAGSTALMSIYSEKFFEKFYIFLTPNVVLLSAGMFLILKNSVVNNKLWIKVRDFASKFTYGIYLVHVVVLLIVEKFGIDWSLIHPIIGIPFTAILCFAVSCLIIYTISKLPFGKYISG